MSDPIGPAGWYPDPHGRYEHRWFNGDEWTNDVATEGRRFVDTGGPSVAPPSGRRRAPGVAAFVLSLVAVVVAWMPFAVVVGIVAAIVALILGARAVQSGRSTGASTSGFAIAGLILGGLALPLSGVGIWLSVVVWGEVRTFLEPGPLKVVITECLLEGTVASAEGIVTNLGDTATGYTVTVTFFDGTSRIGTATVATQEVAAPGADAAFGATAFIDSPIDASRLSCEIGNVGGPYPFGIEVNPPTSP